ncbi:hypothetical protein [Flagellimonas sp. GZD32]|uniref:hypothetical protein n=1 Tax=Flagellimonas cixiensis TaxID=3228750 RepID=UPI0035C921D4
MRKLIWILWLMGCLNISAQNASCNCCSDNHKAFDFWVGEWDVVNTNTGAPSGKSIIKKDEGGCIIRENWTSIATAGYTGTSLNFYNTQTQKWEQLWVDNTGAVLKLKGNREGDQMILTSDPFEKDGKKFRNRISWTKNKDGTVRQLWEVLQEGKETIIAFDGLYRRAEIKKAGN